MIMRRIALLALCLALIAPLFVTSVPPLLDYPNHLARMAVLAARGHDADLAQMYAIDWHIVPNLGMDILVPLLAQIMPLTIAAKVFLGLALILPLLGTVALHDAIFEKRSWWPLASALAVYNATLLAGFLNFTVGVGLALLGTAAWIRLRSRPQLQIAAGAVIATAIFFMHAFGIGFLVLLIAGFELREFWRERNRAALVWRGMKLSLTLLPAVILYFQTRLASDAAATSPLELIKILWWALAKFDPLHKAIGAGADFFTYDTGSDLLILIAVAAAIAALCLARKLAFAWPATIALALMLAYPFVPGVVAGTAWIDTRLPVLAGFLLFAGITPRRLGRRETAVLGLAFAALIVARLGVITLAWQGQNADLADLNAVLTPVKAQDRVLVLTAPPTAAGPASEPVRWRFFVDQPSFWHIAAPALIQHKAFYPQLFAEAAKQPLRVLPPYDKLADDRIGPPQTSLLWDSAQWPATRLKLPYLANWRQDFDYVLVLGAMRLDDRRDFHSDDLDYVMGTKMAALYRVRAREHSPEPVTAQLN
ncbi:MAG TPA: hypothetical protein VHX19_09205 [Stellaceae bacterium]|jgi:hypothetical protein|nr:hypothetical protein [Stellaceae bacterium]